MKNKGNYPSGEREGGSDGCRVGCDMVGLLQVTDRRQGSGPKGRGVIGRKCSPHGA